MSGSLPLDMFWALPTERKPMDRPNTHWRDNKSHLSWEHLGIPLGRAHWWENEYWTSLLTLLALWPWLRQVAQKWMNRSKFILKASLSDRKCRKRTETFSCKQHITTSYKKKITKKSLHLFHHVLTYCSFFSACLTTVNSFQMVFSTVHASIKNHQLIYMKERKL